MGARLVLGLAVEGTPSVASQHGDMAFLVEDMGREEVYRNQEEGHNPEADGIPSAAHEVVHLDKALLLEVAYRA